MIGLIDMQNSLKKYFNFEAIFKAILMTGITVGAGILVTRFTGPLPISVTQTLTQKETTFDTSGSSEITAIPDEAQVRLGINIRQDTVKQAQDQANQIINRISKATQDLGVDKKDIKTQNYQLNPEYDYSHDERKIIGYQINTQILVKLTDFEKLNQIIDNATRLGANQVGGINFSLSEDKRNELKKQAREEAIGKAKQNATELSKLAGIKLGKVVNVIESAGSNSYPQPRYDQSKLMMADKSAPTQIEPGSETYTYNVTLSYETL